MGSDLAINYPTALHVFQQADNWLGFSLSKLAWEGPPADLNDTINTQPALLVHSVAALYVIKELFPGFNPAIVAGHSMGELSALVAAGALPFEDALYLVRKRGELMKKAGESSPGGMAAILGLHVSIVEQTCNEASTPDEVVQIANDNCPGQVVISGAIPALDRALRIAQKKGAHRIKKLAVSIAAHSPLMAHAQEEFSQVVENAAIADPAVSFIGNVSASFLRNAKQIKGDLQAQLNSRVRWTESIHTMIDHGITRFIEIGAGSVLTGLLKRIDPQVVGIAIGSHADINKLDSIISSSNK